MTTRERERAAKAHIEWYMKSNKRNIWQAYDRPSYAKEKAWKYCEDLCDELGGWDLKVIGYNSCIFTAGFLFTDKEDGNIKFMYITPSYDTAVDL